MFAGAKGGGSSFKQTPDNLRSNDTFEGVLGLCVGPIKGPVRGLKSIKIDGTAIENETGQQNFQDFTATLGDGDPLKFPQKVQLKLGAGAAPTQVGLSLPNVGGNNPIWQTKTLVNRNADFIDMRFIVNQLTRQDAKGIYPTTATLEIQMKPVGATNWVNPALGTATAKYKESGIDINDVGGTIRQFFPRDQYDTSGNPYAGAQNYVINGKTTGAAVYELRIGVPNTGAYADTAWDIRVRLLERESYTGGKDGVDQEKRTITWESIAAVYGNTMGEHEDWRGLAWLQTYGKASDQLTGVPEITGEYDTKIMKVPSAAIFTPETRTYKPGVWDGSWAKAYTNDPAWIINDAISDELSGVSLIAAGSYLNKWDALDLSKYCSERVPDGNGGTEPRYTMNIAVSQPQKAEELIRYLAGAVGALAWDQGDGEWRVKVDKADSPSDIFTLDTIEGEFLYSHTDVDTRFNDIIGQFKNAEMDYAMDSVRLFDNESIARIGRKPTTIVLVGCTTRQEALRRVKLRLRSTVNENRNVTFTTNRRGRNIEQLSTILIADGDLGDTDKRTHGRTVARERNWLSDSTFATKTLPLTPFNTNGITSKVIARGVDTDGQSYYDVQISGTSTASGATYPHFYPNVGFAAPKTAPGEVWTATSNVTLIAGALPSAGAFAMGCQYSGGATNAYIGEQVLSPTVGRGLVSKTMVMPANVTSVNPHFQVIVNAGQTVNFTVRIKNLMFEKADSYAGFYVPTAGVSREAVVVRDPLYIAPGVDYKLWFTIPNPNYSPSTATQPTSGDWTKPTISISRNVINTSAQRDATTVVYLDSALPDTVAENLSVALEAPGLPTLPRLFRVMNVSAGDDGERMTIAAINIDTGKWAASDNVSKQDTVFQDLRGAVTPPSLVPGNPLLSLIRVPLAQGSTVNLQSTWVRPSGAFNSGFRIQYSVNGGALQTAVERQQLAEWELPNAGPGLYHVEVCTIDRRGGFSQPLVGELDVTQSLIDATQIKYSTGEVLDDLKPAQAGADVTGANPALDVKNVGGRPVQQVITQIDNTKAAADKSVLDITALTKTVGDYTVDISQQVNAANTARDASVAASTDAQAARDAANAAKTAAGDSAAQSLASKNLSETAKTLAQTAVTDANSAKAAAQSAQSLATTQAGLSDTARQQAQAANTAAGTAKSAAEAAAAAASVSKSDASGFASTAQGQATIATQKADASGQSASTATAQASIATTKAGLASTSASNAATSENNALGSAQAASASQIVTARSASDSAANVLNENRAPAVALSLWAYDQYNAVVPTSRLIDAPAIFQNVGGALRVNSTGTYHTHPIPVVRIQPGKRYRAYARFRMPANTAQPNNHALYVTFWDINGNVLTGNTILLAQAATVTAEQGWVELSRDFSTTGAEGSYQAPAGTVTARVMYRSPGSPVDLSTLYLEDVEAQVAAASSASASAGSASTAATSASLAGTRASASDTSRIAAETAKGLAEGYRNQAAQSVTDANGASNTATTQAGLATTAKNAAQGSANAAQGSAATASTNADLAGTRASAAEASRVAAATAKGGAESARDTAVAASNTATGSSNSAAASALLSAKTAATIGLTPNGDYTGGNTGWSNVGVTYGDWYIGKGFRAGPNARGEIYQDGFTQVDTTHTYRLSARIVAHGSQARETYFGISCFDVNKAGLGNVYGDSLSTMLPGGGVYNVSTEFTGEVTPPSTPSYGYGRKFLAGTVYVKVLTLLNYSSEPVNSDSAALYLEDITSEANARGAASAASLSAGTAAASSDLSGQRASASDLSRQQAQTAQGQAEASRTAAALSESNALGSKNSAASSATLAVSSADAAGAALARQFPAAPAASAFMVNPAANLFVDQSYIPPSSVVNGVVVMDTVSPGFYPYGLWMRGYLPYEAGKTYEVRARAEWVSGYPDSPAINAYFDIYNAAGDLIGESVYGVPTTLPANVQTDLAQRYTLPAHATAKYIRFGLLTNRKPTNLGQMTTGRTNVNALYLADVTDSVSSKASADASISNASAALVSKNAAGVSANAADTSRIAAGTSASEALAYRNTASQSAQTASGASTSATTAQGLAVRAASDAAAASVNENRAPGQAMSLWSYNQYNVFDPTARLIDAPGTFSTVSGNLRVSGTASQHIHPTAPTRVQPGKRYRAFVRFRIPADGSQPSAHNLYVTFFDINGAVLTGNTVQVAAVTSITAAQGWVELSRDFSTTGAGDSLTAPAGTVTARVMYRSSGLMTDISLLYLEDVEAQLAAAASASASSGSASAALASQNAAGGSASAAEGFKNDAKTSSGSAGTARDAAAISASDALGSKNSASASAGLSATAKTAAQLASQATLPENFIDPNNWVAWNNWGGSVVFNGTTALITKGGSFYSNFSIPIAAGQSYRVTARHRVLNQGGGNTYLGLLTNGGNIIWGVGGTASAGVGVWQTSTAIITGDTVLGTAPATVSARIAVMVGYQTISDGEVSLLRVENITSEVAANGSASAANLSAGTAAASANAAGGSASASELSRQAAVTAKGQSEAARDVAVTSKSDAAGSANAAAASAKLAAKSGNTRGITPNGDFASGEGWAASGATYGDWYLGKGYRAGPGVAADVRSSTMVQVDTTHKYRLNVRFAIHGTSAQIYAGIVCYDVNKNFIANVYIPAYANVRYPGGVYSDFGEFNGSTGPAGYGFGTMFAAGTVYVTPLALFNYAGDSVNVDLAGLYLEDITSEVGARGSASAANTSAQSASASQDAAGNSANAANQSRIDAQAANGLAQGAASVANSAAATAGAASTQAQTNATLSASYSGGASNRNSNFANHAGGDQVPFAWGLWAAAQAPYPTSQRAYGTSDLSAGGYSVEGSPYGYTAGSAVGDDSGIYQDFGGSGGYYNVEATVQLLDGAWNGSGVLIYGFNAANGLVASALIDFLNDADLSGLTAGQLTSGFNVRKFKKTIFLGGNSDIRYIRIYNMTGWTGFTGTVSYKQLAWYKSALTSASSSERQAGTNAARIESVNTVLTNSVGSLGTRMNSVEATAGNLTARTSVNETAVTNLKTGQAAARIELTAVTPGGRAAITLRSDNNGGAGVDIVGDVNFMGNLKIQKTVGGNTITIDSEVGFIITAPNGVRVIELVV